VENHRIQPRAGAMSVGDIDHGSYAWTPPVGAENCGTAADQGVQGQRSDLAVTILSPRSMISRCGVPTRVPDARPHAELAGAARTL
jgi:hypothetical protein